MYTQMSLLKYTSHKYITHTANGEVHSMLSLHAWNLNPSLNPKVNPKVSPMGRANGDVPGMLSLQAWNHTCPLPPQDFIAFPLE
jgi:hypothetical protein